MTKIKRGILRIQPAKNGIQYVVNSQTREELKPIVFFDAGNFKRNDNGFQIGFHPHSGIGIITYFNGTDLHHKDSSNNDGIIHDGGAQWISAGGGVWHQEAYRPKHDHPGGTWKGSIHQLWIQLPPEYEEAEVDYNNIKKEEIPLVDHVKIISGSYKGVKGKIKPPINMTYLDITLKTGETFSFDTPENQTTGFIFNRKGSVQVGNDHLPEEHMGILQHTEGKIVVTANDPAEFVLVIAEPSSYDIVSSGSQIHTNISSLEKSAEKIKLIGLQIKQRL